jgi:hypothetical protein
MTSQEFVIWFKGFVAAANTFNITPKQWDIICEQLEKVKDPTTKIGYQISTGTGISGTITTTSERRGDTTYNNDALITKTILND